MNLNNIYIITHTLTLNAVRYPTFNDVHDSISAYIWNHLNLSIWNFVGDAVKIRAYNPVQHPIRSMYESR
jgi:hypothetical protein